MSIEDKKEKSEKSNSSEEESQTPKSEESDETPDETSDETSEETSEEEEDELNEEQQEEAKKLYAALLDPKKREEVLRALISQAGIKIEESTKAESTRSTKRQILDILGEALGPEFKFLSERLGKAIESILTQERESTTNLLREEIGQIRAMQVKRETDSALNKLARETKGESRKFESKMAALMDKIPQGPDVSIEEYIRILYHQASVGSAGRAAINKVKDKINRNATDASSRLKSSSDVAKPAKKLDLDSAIRFAMEQLEKQE